MFGSGQQLLVIAGIFLLTIFMLTFYRSSTTQSSQSIDNEAIITASGVGGSIEEKILMRAFDEATIESDISSPTLLTNPSSIGPDVGESNYSQYDDVDDFNNYAETTYIERLGNFISKVKVFYVDRNSPFNKSTVQTFAKQIDIFVTNNYLVDTVRISLITTY